MKNDDEAIAPPMPSDVMRCQFGGAPEFSGRGTLALNLTAGGRGEFSVCFDFGSLGCLQSAPYELWWQGARLSTANGSLRVASSSITQGADRLGAYDDMTLQWEAPGAAPGTLAWGTTFRCHSHGPLRFIQSFPAGWRGELGRHADVDTAATSFPSFRFPADPALRAVTFRGQNAAQSTHFGPWPESYRGGYLGGPLALMPTAMDAAIVLSPLDQFMIVEHSLRTEADGSSTLSFGALGLLEELPRNATLEFVLAAEPAGVNASRPRAGLVASAFMHWGDLLRQYHGGTQALPNASTTMSTLGYSTTGVYHYNPCDCVDNPSGESCGNTSSPNLPGCKTYQDTLVAVMADARKRGLPYKWLLIDSWWHAYDAQEYFEDVPQQVSALFPNGLRWLADKEEVSFSAHWSASFGPQSPYRKIAPESWYCAVDSTGAETLCIPTDEAVFDHIFQSDQSWRLKTIKIDHVLSTLIGSNGDNGDGTCPGPLGWPHPGHECRPGERTAMLRNKSQPVMACLTSPVVAERFLTSVARAAERWGVDIEWCMSYRASVLPLTRHHCSAPKSGTLTTRVPRPQQTC